MDLWSLSDQANTGVDSGTNPYRHKDAVYFLPSEDEWYKAAYHQNDGVTANYWDYPTGGNDVPDGIDFAGDPNYEAVFFDGYSQDEPNTIVSVGSSASAYGTFGQGGNIDEWMESAWDGLNDSSSEGRNVRGGFWDNSFEDLNCSDRDLNEPWVEFEDIGFRVASVEVIPEPTTFALLSLGSLALVMGRRRK
jgi:formylglycine-generating enzyme required for sulfatase activity